MEGELAAHPEDDTLHPSQGLLCMEGNGALWFKNHGPYLKANRSQIQMTTAQEYRFGFL